MGYMAQHFVDYRSIVPCVECVLPWFSRRSPVHEAIPRGPRSVILIEYEHGAADEDRPTPTKFCIGLAQRSLELIQTVLQPGFCSLHRDHHMIGSASASRKQALDAEDGKIRRISIVSLPTRSNEEVVGRGEVVVEDT